jgi:two-component system, cell cycle sensor histidine kinase and response regulator CckA
VLLNAVAVFDETGNYVMSRSTMFDNTDRQQAEEAIKFQNALLTTQLETSVDGILVVGTSGKIISSNQRFIDMWEISSDIMDSKSDDLALKVVIDKLARPEEFIAKVRRLYADPVEKSQDEILLKDGRTFERYSAPMKTTDKKYIGRVWYFRDITKRRLLEEKLMQSQKMEVVGQMAGGIAHDFNNLLSTILGWAEVVMSKMKPEEGNYRFIEEIHKAARRAAELTHQLLAFSRKQKMELNMINLNDKLKSLESMLTGLLGGQIVIKMDLDANLGSLWLDSSQIDQVVLNLAVNARDAMPLGGVITITTSSVELAEEEHESKSGTVSRRWVRLSFSDDGCGMDEATKSHLFEPYFTTKAQGKGTGLGLSTVYGIVNQLGGRIEVKTAAGQGTTFDIFFPRAEAGSRPG